MFNIKEIDILNSIKSIQYLTKDKTSVTIKSIADYYEVTIKAIQTTIERNKQYIIKDGLYYLKGEKLKSLKENNLIGKRTVTLTVLSNKAMLHIGFLLSSKIATKLKEVTFINNKKLYKEFSIDGTFRFIIKKYERELGYLLFNILGKYNKINTQVICGKYKIDFVINNKLAIECDENGHSGYNNNDEILREKYIRDEGYILVRYDTRNNNMLNFIGEVIQKLDLIHN